MHLFFHLSKDHGIFRFKCKFANCETEHYRKDQMENHMSKVHGQINHELMEDRSVELYDQVQQLSMELLGTLGNKPGPTAAQAQQMYDQSVREQEFRKRKRDGDNMEDAPLSMVDNPLEAFQQMFKKSVQDSSFESGRSGVKTSERQEDLLECKLCRKSIINRVCYDIGVLNSDILIFFRLEASIFFTTLETILECFATSVLGVNSDTNVLSRLQLTVSSFVYRSIILLFQVRRATEPKTASWTL